MPKIVEIKESDGEIWVRIGKIAADESGMALWSPKEQRQEKQMSYNLGYGDAIEGRPRYKI